MRPEKYSLRLKRLHIDTYKEAVIYMREDCQVCRAEGFEAPARIRIDYGKHSIIATLNTIKPDAKILNINEASLSEYAWTLLNAKEGEKIYLSHPKPLQSLSYIHSKIYGNNLQKNEINKIIQDVLAGNLSDVQIAAFLAASAGRRLTFTEITDLTSAMINVGDKLQWEWPLIVDKHSIGGLPGNRTSLIVVPIVAAFGLKIPKTSSRAITSPAGTADTMEVFAPVELDLKKMRKVVERENGCIIWGGAASLSPADDILIRVERALDLDSEGQLVASVLSKKIAAGATHIVIDMPIGNTTKVRSLDMANILKKYMEEISHLLGVTAHVIFTDGSQPVGRGIGPALEARDILSVLNNEKNAPQDLRARAILLAGEILEFSSKVEKGEGQKLAQEILDSGKALKKFQAICQAQGAMREPILAGFTHVIESEKTGKVVEIDNRKIARVAKLAGAPNSKGAGIEMHVMLGERVEKRQPLYTIYSETPGELEYALEAILSSNEIIHIEKNI